MSIGVSTFVSTIFPKYWIIFQNTVYLFDMLETRVHLKPIDITAIWQKDRQDKGSVLILSLVEMAVIETADVCLR